MSKVKKEKKSRNAVPKEERFFYRHRVGIRVCAGVMVAVYIAGSALAYRIQIREIGLQYVGTVLQYASEVTEENTGYLSQSTLDRAWRVLRTAILRPHTYEEYDTYASLAIAKGDYEKAIGYMQGCIDTWEDSDSSELATLWLRQGSLYTLTEQYETAVDCYDRALSLDDSLSSAYLLRAQMRSELGDEDGAVADLLGYEERAGENPLIEAALGDLYMANEQYEQAFACYTQAIDSGNYDTEYLLSRGKCSVMLEDYASALDDLNRYMNEGGEDSDGSVNALIGVCRMDTEDYSGAVSAFRSAISSGYSDPVTLYQQIVICGYTAGDYEAVEKYGTLAIEAAEKDADTDAAYLAELYQWVGLSEFMQSDYENAADSLENALSLDTSRDALWYYLGVSLMAEESWDAAADAFKASLNAEDTPEDAQYYLGCCLISAEHYEEAHEAFLASSELEGFVTSSFYNAAVCSFQMTEYTQAKKELQSAIQANDDEDVAASAQALYNELKSTVG